MVIVMRSGAGEEQIHAVIDRLNAFGFDVHRSSGLHRTVLGAIGSKPDFDVRHIASLDGVEVVHRITVPYERVLSAAGDPPGMLTLGGRRFGPGAPAVLVSLPAEDVRDRSLEALARAGIDAVGVPARDPRTVARALEGSGGLPVIAEIAAGGEPVDALPGVTAVRLTGTALFDHGLRRGVTGLGLPVIVDRAPGSTLSDWLQAADRLLLEGCREVALCDAGSHSLDPGRSMVPDIAALAFVRVRTGLPALADPGRAIADPEVALVAACAAAAAGASGVVLGLRERDGRPDAAGLEAAVRRLRTLAAAAADEGATGLEPTDG